MMTKRFNFIFILLLIVSSAIAQNKEEKMAMEALGDNEYAKAINLFKKAYAKSSADRKSHISYHQAYAYMKKNEPKLAERWFKKAISSNYPEANAIYYLAEMQKKNGKFEDAIATFKKYKKVSGDDQRAENGIKSCELAANWIENPSRYEVENMPLFNSKDMDFSPCWGKKDYRIVYFSSTRSGSKGEDPHAVTGYGFTDIFVANQDRKGNWGEPMPVPGEGFNTPNDEGASCTNIKGSVMFFTRCKVEKNKSLGCKIYQASKRGAGFTEGKLIAFEGSDDVSYGHPAIDARAMTIYFSADMPGGYGGNDIWMMKRTKKTAPFGDPINLGPEINTPGNEVYPTIRRNGELYFSSDYHPGMGGLDIFKAVYDKKTKTYSVKNMKYPINSAADDFGIIFEGNKEKGYLTSSRPGGKGAEDIYRFELPPLKFTIKGIVKDAKNNQPLPGAKVVLTDNTGASKEEIATADGSYQFKLKADMDYQIMASKEKYLNEKVGQSTKGIDNNQDFVVDIALKAIWIPIKIENIFYEFGKADLRPESMASLEKLVGVLNDNPTVTIELGAHTDFRGSDKANLSLSQKRAESVVNYLISKGIDKGRLKAKGYGESQPASVGKVDADRLSFAKEGDVLTPEYINKLSSEEEKEEAHQLNRRTEFKVLKTDYKASPKPNAGTKK